jgi:DNA-binding transcriptional LysR family regulator
LARVEHIDWLETFVAVVDHGGFSAAAVAVHRSQSRISAHIAALESALGATLFDRRHRPVGLTDAGTAYLPHAREALAALDGGMAKIEAVRGLASGTVILGSYPSASAAFLPNLVRSFGERYPQVKVHLVELSTVELTEALNSGEVHLALRALTPLHQTQSLACRPLWREPLVAAMPQGHPLTEAPRPIPIPALVRYPLITIGGSMRQEVMFETDLAFDEAETEPRIAWQTDQPQTLANFVRAGLGVGVTNALAMHVSDTAGLHVAAVGCLEQGRDVGVFWDPDRYMPAAARALLDAILAAPVPATTHPVVPRQRATSATTAGDATFSAPP